MFLVFLLIILIIPVCSYSIDSSYFDYDENFMKVTQYEVLGKLPNPFIMDNGERVKTKEDWDKRRKEIYKTAVELQYGTIPPKPEVFKSEICYQNHSNMSVRITCGTKEKQITWTLKILLPKGVSNPPVVLDGDLCFNVNFNSEYVNEYLSRGIALATFDRTVLANDNTARGRRTGPLYEMYPDYTFGALGAWAWGFMRCADALEMTNYFDMSALAFTGHSRGAKTAMLAGVLDERAKIVNPNNSNACSCSCYRIHSEIVHEDGNKERNETLKDLWDAVGYWIGSEMGNYADREADLPFDCHYLKALVAPRILLVGEATSDGWTNEIGSWQTSMAATEIYKFLGCENNLKWYYRKGYHDHLPVDAAMLCNVILNSKGKEELYPYFYKRPFKEYERIWNF